MSDIEKTLEERGSRYGEFDEHARVTQNIKAAMRDSLNWEKLAPDQKEALEMVAHKIGRILNGDPNFIDSWHDQIGYLRLVEQRLERGKHANVEVDKQFVKDTAPKIEPLTLEDYNRFIASRIKDTL